MKEELPVDPRIKKIGEKLKKLRQERGYTSYETFAFDNNLPRVGYGNHEKGSNITIGSLLRILDIHKVPLKDFFSDFN